MSIKETDIVITNALGSLTNGGSLPHAVIIESDSDEKAKRLATLLAMYTLCTGDDRPCGECTHCLKAENGTHPDVTNVLPDPKTKGKIYSMDTIRNIISDASVLPNEARGKVYIFEQTDHRLSNAVNQNALLKLLEEPPANVSFILICKSIQSLLPTILSRCTSVRLKGQELPEGEVLETARKIVSGIVSPSEYDLLLALNELGKNNNAEAVLAAVKILLRDALALLCGAKALCDPGLAKTAAARLTKQKLLQMAELCDDAVQKIKQHANINLLATWLCGEFRRISWQR